MSGKVIVVGAKGRFGRNAVTAFQKANWQVRAYARNWDDGGGQHRSLYKNADCLTGDITDTVGLTEASQGMDVILHAVNPPYPDWQEMLPQFTQSALAAAQATGATLMIPGNVYNYGAGMPTLLRENTPHRPTTKKGRLRETMEHNFKAAANDGVRTIILRAGDFFEREKTGNWFDSFIAAKVGKGKVVYPGPLDRDHAWAYLPDLARAMVGLAEQRDQFAAFEEFGFPGHTLSGQDLINAIENTIGKSTKSAGFPWPLIQVLGLVSPMLREVNEMKYLWQTPHRIDGTKLSHALPDFKETPLPVAIADALVQLINEPPAQSMFHQGSVREA